MNMRIMCNEAAGVAAAVTCLTLFVIGDAYADSGFVSPRTAHQITREAPAAAPQNISEACGTFRADFGNLHNALYALTLNTASVNGTSRVFVAIGEGTDAGKFIGNTAFTLFDVAPRSGGVDLLVQVTTPGSPQVSVDYLICNP